MWFLFFWYMKVKVFSAPCESHEHFPEGCTCFSLYLEIMKLPYFCTLLCCKEMKVKMESSWESGSGKEGMSVQKKNWSAERHTDGGQLSELSVEAKPWCALISVFKMTSWPMNQQEKTVHRCCASDRWEGFWPLASSQVIPVGWTLRQPGHLPPGLYATLHAKNPDTRSVFFSEKRLQNNSSSVFFSIKMHNSIKTQDEQATLNIWKLSGEHIQVRTTILSTK